MRTDLEHDKKQGTEQASVAWVGSRIMNARSMVIRCLHGLVWMVCAVGALDAAEVRRIESLAMELVPIPAGEFVMGSPETEDGHVASEGPLTRVTLPQAFWLGRYEVTYAQWKALMGTDLLTQARLMLADDSLYQLGGKEQTVRQRIGLRKDADPHEALGNLDEHAPMYWVNWHEAAEFCLRLTRQERAAGRIPPGYEYRLPTEAEWEYASRAGTSTATYAGEIRIEGARNAPVLDAIAWYAGNSSVGYVGKGWDTRGWEGKQYPGGLAGPRTVGTREPNAWGLYDMLGNVNEWCADWFADRLPGGRVSAPHGPATGVLRVIRGGSWFNHARSERAADRDWSKPGRRFHGLGFRVALAPMLSGSR
jgi:formylglycine-generating enzyme required for sulfatase activity